MVGKHVVSLVRHEDTYSSLRKALELCDGLKSFNKNDRILIKPNLVNWDFNLPYPPYGVVTTTAVVFALVRGEAIEDHSEFLPYDWEWTDDNTGPVAFRKRGIKGLAVRKYDNSLCTACLQNKDNPHIKKAIRISGCPPDIKKFEALLREEGIDCDYGQYIRYRHYLFNRYLDKEEFDRGLFIR